MTKTDKKREKSLVAALTRVCDEALESIAGFKWITHFVDYNRFPDSLVIVSVFARDEQLQRARVARDDRHLAVLISTALEATGVSIPATSHQIRFDTEEACEREHRGNWQARYRYAQLH